MLHLPSLHPASIDWLSCPWVRGPKFCSAASPSLHSWRREPQGTFSPHPTSWSFLPFLFPSHLCPHPSSSNIPNQFFSIFLSVLAFCLFNCMIHLDREFIWVDLFTVFSIFYFHWPNIFHMHVQRVLECISNYKSAREEGGILVHTSPTQKIFIKTVIIVILIEKIKL